MRRLLPALLLLALPWLAWAGGAEVARMAQIAEVYANKEHFSGSVLVSRNGKVLLDKSYGAPADSRYPIGCITFQFTAAAVLLLEQDGKLHLDDPVSAYLPEAPPGWKDVTLRHLLLHRAGLDGFGSFPEAEDLFAQKQPPEALMRRAFETFPAPEPDKRPTVSPWGYALLGVVIERASGVPYGDFLQNRLFTPLGMTATAYRSDDPAALSTWLFSAGGVVSTPRDLARCEEAPYGGKLLSPSALHEMTSPLPGTFYAMGLLRLSGDGHPYFIHDGVLIPDGGGFLIYRPEDRTIVAVLGRTDEGVTYDLSQDLAAAARGEKVLLKSEQGSTATSNVLKPLEKLPMPGLDRERGLILYVPPGYAEHPERRYPVIYMQDAEDLFDVQTAGSTEWRVDETLNALARSDGLEAIAVGIYSGEKRMSELNPYPGPPLAEAEGPDYMRFIVEVVKPYIDRTYRTLPDRAHTAIMGASMGGLISHYALQAYPQIFSKYAFLSTSYWASPELVDRAEKQRLPPDTRIYLYVGGEEAPYMESDTRAMAGILARQGRAEDIMLQVDPGGEHNNKARQRAFPHAVKWLFEK